MFDGSTDQEQTHHWARVMRLCIKKNAEWRTYAAAIWELNEPYDIAQEGFQMIRAECRQ